jgi:hypothetical protein
MPDTLQPRMPAGFIGHGTPFNALHDNDFTLAWRKLSQSIPKRKAILAISPTGTSALRLPPPPPRQRPSTTSTASQ